MLCKLCDVYSNFDVICENLEYYLTFDNYGLHFGHILLIPKQHVLNFSETNIYNDLLVLRIVDAMKEYFKTDIVVYEHGNITENKTNNISIDHAHLHFLPLTNGYNELKNIIKTTVNTEHTEFQQFYSEKHYNSYHFFSLNGQYSLYTYDKWKSQAFREAYAKSEKISKWNWKTDGQDIIRHNLLIEERKKQVKSFLIRWLKNVGVK